MAWIRERASARWRQADEFCYQAPDTRSTSALAGVPDPALIAGDTQQLLTHQLRIRRRAGSRPLAEAVAPDQAGGHLERVERQPPTSHGERSSSSSMESRENEGDLMVAAEHPDYIAMAYLLDHAAGWCARPCRLTGAPSCRSRKWSRPIPVCMAQRSLCRRTCGTALRPASPRLSAPALSRRSPIRPRDRTIWHAQATSSRSGPLWTVSWSDRRGGGGGVRVCSPRGHSREPIGHAAGTTQREAVLMAAKWAGPAASAPAGTSGMEFICVNAASGDRRAGSAMTVPDRWVPWLVERILWNV